MLGAFLLLLSRDSGRLARSPNGTPSRKKGAPRQKGPAGLGGALLLTRALPKPTAPVVAVFGGAPATISIGALSGSVGIVFGETGALKGAGALVGSAGIVFGQNGALVAKGALSGSVGITFGQAGTLTGSGKLVGTAGVIFGQAGTLQGSGKLVGTAGVVFGQHGTLTGGGATGAISGAASIVFAAKVDDATAYARAYAQILTQYAKAGFMFAYSVNFTAPINSTITAVGAGQMLYLSTDGYDFVLASSGLRSGLARGIATAPSNSNTVAAQVSGIIPASVTGLTPGASQLVRVNQTSSNLERVATPTAGDELAGWAYTDGSVMLLVGAMGQLPIFYGVAAPTTGTWATGQIVLNAAPSAGGFAGWICVAGGAPGTWKTYGVIST